MQRLDEAPEGAMQATLGQIPGRVKQEENDSSDEDMASVDLDSATEYNSARGRFGSAASAVRLGASRRGSRRARVYGSATASQASHQVVQVIV